LADTAARRRKGERQRSFIFVVEVVVTGLLSVR
jgi:hypothetical protein